MLGSSACLFVLCLVVTFVSTGVDVYPCFRLFPPPLSACLPACLPACLSICLPVSVSACLLYHCLHHQSSPVQCCSCKLFALLFYLSQSAEAQQNLEPHPLQHLDPNTQSSDQLYAIYRQCVPSF